MSALFTAMREAGVPEDAVRSFLEMLADRDRLLAEWEKLRDPAALHANLLRGEPARLTREQLCHLAGADHLRTENERLRGVVKRLTSIVGELMMEAADKPAPKTRGGQLDLEEWLRERKAG